MRFVRKLALDERAAAAAEMALVTPLLLIIMFGSIELGNYFMNEHRLVKSVRDGARFAARYPFSNYTGCGSTAADVPSTLRDDVKTVVRKGSLNAAADDLLPNWSSNDTTFTVQVTCSTAVGSQSFGGIYTGNSVGTANAGPVVTVTASLPYKSVLGSFGFTGLGFALTAKQQAAVMGI
jgi:Flp pilus assembly protein TadG